MSVNSFVDNNNRKVTILLDEDIGYYRFEVLAFLFSTIGDLLNECYEDLQKIFGKDVEIITFECNGEIYPFDYMIGNITDGSSDLELRANFPNNPFVRMNNVSILQRNMKECINASQVNMDPSVRPRFNEGEHPTPRTPTTGDFANLLDELKNDFKQISFNLKDLAAVLKLDQKFYDHGKIENQRRVIQNNLDTVRYCAPMMVNLTKLKIPIGGTNGKLQVIDVT